MMSSFSGLSHRFFLSVLLSNLVVSAQNMVGTV
jgi:hypothetical protein